MLIEIRCLEVAGVRGPHVLHEPATIEAATYHSAVGEWTWSVREALGDRAAFVLEARLVVVELDAAGQPTGAPVELLVRDTAGYVTVVWGRERSAA